MPPTTASLAGLLTREQATLRNPGAPQLVELALAEGEGILTAQGAISLTTGKYTGRSPRDKYIVAEPSVAHEIDWGSTNLPITPERFEPLYNRLLDYIACRRLFVQDGFAGADPAHRVNVRVVTELAWQCLFAHQLFIRPEPDQLRAFTPDLTVICVPSFRANPVIDGTRSETFIIISFAHRLILIGGTHYAGEIKKAVFTALNYLLPTRGVFPMHCAANLGHQGDTALFFGLSGTGKTTLSADPHRRLIGDDEHGWSEQGIFNLEGGCYAKCIGLSAEQEPQIWNAIRFGSLLENVAVDPEQREPDYGNAVLTENTRAAYPIEYMPGAVLPGVADHPNTIIFLAADAFGVLPPLARLTQEQALYHFLSGYTSKLAGTERGVTAPQATFSPCFGGPFLPLAPERYAALLGQKLTRHNTRVFLVNTGWTGGPHGKGRRLELGLTRAMVSAVLEGRLDTAEYEQDPTFRLWVPKACPGVPSHVLRTRQSWTDPAAYDRQARALAEMFKENFTRFTSVDPALIAAGPDPR